MLELLLRNIHSDIDMMDNEGRTALHYAAASCGLNGDPTMYYMLIEHGARDDVSDCEGFTPVDVRTNPSLVDVERARQQNQYPSLMANEWDSLFSSLSESALCRMIIDGELDLCQAPSMPQHEEVFGRLAQMQAQILGIWDAINAEDDRTLKQLLFQKEMAVCKDSYGRTPLHMAYKLHLVCKYIPQHNVP
ncbi:unnamed protein product [Heligmosomoides polygyrus]|uniref:ANK_REP_REGION domain-containing protein n=1 Tax=Heligmosomoides polygyrus TaxID=6339 RepID=A0A183FMG1_HELPZ|nr:unnamed protein product [Heligmosomoides polygyrus]